ncbi:ABC transporter ATP-binding protein [Streptomyces netropsis]|uniref:ABC-type multidrug transport system ATPase subunit n=1 Tax=Streptomyces netropsis TaxID=55404 RepID=A0A7W7LGU7_STRNE|nr:ABC transporter ATP-binding protein [Streptomyces netropsis]MBB4889975.1 ABC-type multidrug transport system ATPase subunit [Streptomyces netropsis]GGR42789.1 ABC transporter ATP-binding protein [Streptomyces netropsis]
MRLTGVGRRYGIGGSWVLRGVDLDVRPGSLVRIEGANGSGKSTLLRLLAGIDAPTTGRITGRPRTAFVPERFPAALPFTAIGYLTMLGRVHGLSRSAAASAAALWLERFGAAEHARTRLSELSKGSSQKVAVAQGLLADPGLLVLDEAWTGLDQASRAVLDRAVTDRVAAGATVVYVDHDPGRLAGVPDAVFRVDAGRLVAVASAGTAGAADLRDGLPGPRGRSAARPAGPRVSIEAEGPSGAHLPEGLPGDPVHGPLGPVAPDAPAVHRLTVAAAHSDALLRALLAARPAWHIRAVTTTEPAHVEGEPGR